MDASENNGDGTGTGTGLGTLGFGALREPPLSPPAAQASWHDPEASSGTSSNGNGSGLIAPTDQSVHGPLGGPAVGAHDSGEGAPAETPSLPAVDLYSFAIDRSAARLIPEQVAHLHTALPIGFEQGLPLVAIADGSDGTMQSVRAALGCDARFTLASRADLVASIAAAYTAPASGAIRLATPATVEPVPMETMPTVAPVDPLGPIGEIEVFAPLARTAEVELAPIETEEQAPVEALTTVTPADIATIAPIAPVEALPSEQPAATVETVEPTMLPIEPLADILEPTILETEPPMLTTEPPAAVFEPAMLETEPPMLTTEPFSEILEPAKPATGPTMFTAGPAETATEVEAVPEAEPAPPTTSCRVVIRLSGAEPVEAGAFDSVGEAKDRAFEIVGQLTSEDGSWPYFRGRYLRPDAIVSVDIVEESSW